MSPWESLLDVQEPARPVLFGSVSHPPKIPELTLLVDRLRSDLGSNYFVEVDHWDDDLAAIGLGCSHSPGVLVYLSMASGDLAYVECELPVEASDDEVPYRVTYKADDLDYAAVREVVRLHLGRSTTL